MLDGMVGPARRPDLEQLDEPVVVVGVDGTDRSLTPLRWADRQAQLLGARLLALTAFGTGLTDEPEDADVARTASAALERCIEAALTPERASRVLGWVDADEPAHALTRVRDWRELLVVLGAHHVSVLRPLGSVTAHVAGRAPAPVAVVHGRPERSATGRVVVGVDGSPYSEAALRWAGQYADRAGASLHAVLAWSGPPDPHGPSTGRYEVQQERILHEELARVASRAPTGQQHELEGTVQHGDPVRVLRELAAAADLVVVGSHGQGRVLGRPLGSVAQHLVRSCEAPVVIVADAMR